MKKLMSFFKTHRVFTMLMAIVLVCAIVVCTVLIQCFYIGNGSDKYGDRLEGISEHEISSSRLDDFKNNVSVNEKVKSTKINIQGRIIYITLQILEGTDIEEAKSIALKSLENFSEDELSYYDVNVTMKQGVTKNEKNEVTNEGFIISGYKNKKAVTIVWNNNRPVTKAEADPNVSEQG